MARYIEKEPLCAWLENMGVSDFIIRKIESEANFPTADVVPKSEYDDLKFQFEALDHECDRLEAAESRRYDAIVEAKADAAKKIFEEFENILEAMIQLNYAIGVQHEDPIERAKAISAEQALRAFRDYVAELKKKYQEGEPNGQKIKEKEKTE